MSARLDFILDTNSPRQDTLFSSYTQQGSGILNDLVRNDQVIAISVQPVTLTPPGGDTLYTADYESTDVFRVAVGDVDEPPEGGTIALQVGATTSGLTALTYDITAAALTTALNAALTTEAEPLCLVTLVEAGVYQIDAVSNGAITTGFFAVASDALLQPDCDAFFMEQSLGGASSRYQVFLVMRQAPTAYSEPATALTAAGVTIATTQSGSATANKIQKISFDAAQTYGGTYRISGTIDGVTATCCIAKPLLEADDLAALLTGHPEIFYQDLDPLILDNIVVTKSGADFFVEFVGTLGSEQQKRTISDATIANPTELTFSANHGWVTGQSITITGSSGTTPSLDGAYAITVTAVNKVTIPLNVTAATAETGTAINTSQPVLAVTNIDLIAPLGRSGTLNLNTVSLYRKSLLVDTDSFTQKFSIQRERASGEIRTLILADITIKKEIIDVASMVPTPRPSYYTSAATDALLALKQNILATYVSINATYSILTTDQIIEAVSGTFTATLPTAVGVRGKGYYVKNSGSGTLTLATTSAQNIDNATTQTLAQYDDLLVVSNNSYWIIL